MRYSLWLGLARVIIPVSIFFLAGKPVLNRFKDIVENDNQKRKIENAIPENTEENPSLRDSLMNIKKDTFYLTPREMQVK